MALEGMGPLPVQLATARADPRASHWARLRRGRGRRDEETLGDRVVSPQNGHAESLALTRREQEEHWV